MKFSPKRVMAVCWKDLTDLKKNRGLLASLFALPGVLILVPVGVVYSYIRNPTDPSLRAMASFYDPKFPLGGDAVRFLLERSVTDWLSMYLLMPVFIPILISSHAVAGEKERRTLEPLLASPVTSLELLLGKSLASLIPAYFISLASFVLMCIAVDSVTWKYLHSLLLPNSTWLFGVLVVAPMFSFLGNGVAILVSARVSDSRLAQQLAGLIILPMLGLSAGQVAGFLQAGPSYYAVIAGVVLVADVLLLVAAVRLFDRERLVSKWL